MSGFEDFRNEPMEHRRATDLKLFGRLEAAALVAKTSYLRFALQDVERSERKTERFTVYSAANETVLGVVQFWSPWRKYVFAPQSGTLFDPACLAEVGAFLESETKKWRDGLKSKSGRKRA